MPRDERTRRAVLQAVAAGGVAVLATPVITGSVAADHDPDDGPVYDEGDTPTRDGEWNQRENGRVYIYYQDEHENDAELIDSYVTNARQAVNEIIEGNSDSHIELYIMPYDEYERREDYHTFESRSDDDALFEYFRLNLRPPTENPRYETEDERDRASQETIAEEYFRMILLRLVAIHRGQSNYRAVMPRWFTAGFPAYIAHAETPFGDDRFDSVIEQVAVDVQEEPDTFDVVRDGDEDTTASRLLLNEYMMGEYGFEAMLHLAVEESDSFEEAVETHFDVSMDEFEAGFESWIGNAYPVPETSTGERELEGDGEIPEDTTPVEEEDNDWLWWVLGAASGTAAASGGYLAFDKYREDEDGRGESAGAVNDDVDDAGDADTSGD